jgi:serine phosphatase RsbU (regulator of sigma subunit)
LYIFIKYLFLVLTKNKSAGDFMKKFFISGILFGLIAGSIFGQYYKTGIPFIRNYTPVETTGSEQNWAVVQDKRGVMYFGNNDDGVLEYDGVNWRSIPVTNNSIVRSLAIDSLGTVYVGAVGEFGYLAPNEFGMLEYQSLIPILDSADLDFTNVWKTYVFMGNTYFCSQKKVFIYFPAADTMKVINNKTYTFLSFIVDGEFYQGDFGSGLLILDNDSITSAKGGEFFIQKNITCILPYTEKELFIGTLNDGAFLYETETGEVTSDILSLIANDYIKERVLYHGFWLDNERLALATLYGGLIILDRDGKIIQKFDKNSGLQNETVIYAYSNPENTGQFPLWLALNIGISKAEINSPIRLFDENSGLSGTINDITRFNNTLYVATSSGVYYMDEENPGIVQFLKVENINTQCWSFLTFNAGGKIRDKLLIGTIRGLYEITGKGDGKLLDESILNNLEGRTYYIFKLYNSLVNPATVYLGTNEALITLVYENGIFKQVNIEGYQDEIRSIVEDEEGNLWLGTSIKGVIKLGFLSSGDTIITKYTTDDGLPSMDRIFVYLLDNEVCFATSKGIYHFNEEVNNFLPDSTFGARFADGSVEIFRMKTDKDGDLWMSYDKDNRWYETFVSWKEGRYIENNLPFFRLPNKSTDAIFCDEDGIVWLGKSTELYRFDKKFVKEYEIPFYTLIRQVILGEDSVVFYGTNYSENISGRRNVDLNQPESLKPVIKYEDNNITFQWAAPFFEEENATEYRYWLEGDDENWTRWSDRTEFPFTNLHQGDYKFHVQSKNIYGIESEIGTFEFSILPPWYQTVLAYVIYVILAIILIIVIVKLYTRRLKMENIRLEGIIQERTAEIRKQKEELTDSIEYASRIQRALLPSEKVLNENLPEHFILFKPRDIVSGDFYWMTEIDNKLLVVAADCTGHGVPGAFMSMLGISFLNEIVNKLKVTQSNEILDELRKHVMESLKQTGEIEGETKDGMDLALCVIDKEHNKIQYSGAYNPLYIVRPLLVEEKNQIKRGDELELPRGAIYNEKYMLTQVKPDKMPIGISAKNLEPFTYNELDLKIGYSLYIFSDGYVDQFGGPLGKKFMSKAFKELILEIQDTPMTEQGNIMDEKLIEWMGNLNQVDDIIVIGLKIE